MTAATAETAELAPFEELLAGARATIEKILGHARAKTAGSDKIDDHQVLVRRIANLATRVEAAERLLEAAREHRAEIGRPEPHVETAARLFACETARALASECDLWLEEFGLSESDLPDAAARAFIRAQLAEKNYREFGSRILAAGADNNRWIRGAEAGEEAELRAMTRRFARDVVAPQAEHIHRHDLIVPEEFISQMSELGFFGMAIPDQYGGVGMTNLMMIIATEELSAASLSAAGSLITRPEILAKALLKGGTEAQKKKWLEPVAQGRLMVGVAVTEPNVGSDVASLSCRATAAMQDGKAGYLLNGAKAWCTFAGRANILALLARTDPNPAAGHKGLSLFIVEKDPFDGHEFTMTQPGGGKIAGKADPTPGYRGMHSFTLQIEDYFVPAENLVGEEGGKGKGFYLQMGGFTAGRLQTGGRAIGLAQAALEVSARYAAERPQFGRPIAEFQSTQYELGAMAVELEAARRLTYAAARAMDDGDPRAALLAAMAKLFACRAAVCVSQRGQVLHGGWGYAEEYPISRYVVDALVLPIFEGVEPILEMKVIGRGLLASTES